MYLISIVLPCYNEYKSLPILLNKAYYITDNYPIQIVFLNNGSTDGTQEYFENQKEHKGIVFAKLDKNKGYGFGLKYAIKFCEGEYIGWTHADLQTDLFDIVRAFEAIKKYNLKNNLNDRLIIKGIRYARPFSEMITSVGMSLISRVLFFPKPIYEINAQPSLFHKTFLNLIDSGPDDYGLDIYVFVNCFFKNTKVLRIPVLFPERQFGLSHWNTNFFAKLSLIKKQFLLLIKIFIFNLKF
tara:strand:+ start:3947 stop:4669 length:723 start_codon:yes stop_codon:yes gene_type:complete